MKINKLAYAISCGAIIALTSCSDDFLDNKPQGSLSDGVMNSTESVELLVNSAYAGLSGFTNEQGNP